MDNQTAFNLVWERAKDQRKATVRIPDTYDSGGSCVYRSPNGLKCFAGVLIPDELYQPTFENTVISGLVENKSQDRDRPFPPEDIQPLQAHLADCSTRLLDRFQTIHDSYEVSEWESRLMDLAREFNLSVPA